MRLLGINFLSILHIKTTVQ